MSQYIVKVNSQQDASGQVSVEGGGGLKGQTVRIKATDNRVEVVDVARKQAPEKIRVKRNGKDLAVVFEEGSLDSPDLILEGFFDGASACRLTGRSGDGAATEYQPDSGRQEDQSSRLVDAAASPQTLGSQRCGASFFGPDFAAAQAGSATAGAGAATSGMNPLLSVLGGVLGLAALAGGGGGGGGDNTDRTPPAPGSFNADGTPAVTKSLTPTFAGTGTPGDTIRVVVGGQTLTATVAPNGTWSATPTTPLAEGIVTATVTAADPAGNVSAPITRSVNIDITPPAAGSFNANGTPAVTNDTTPTFSGTGTPGDTITVTVGGQTVTATVAANGTWSATPANPLPQGAATASITATDPAGNTSTPITRSVNIDTTAPAAGSFNANGTPAVTNDTTPTFAGTGTPGDTIRVSVGGQTLTATVAPDGTWSATPTTPLPEGPATASITATDPAGNTSAPITRSVNVDTTAPAAGSFNANGTPAATNDTTPTFAGTGTPGDTITVTVGGQTLTATVAPDGTWSATPTTPLPEGPVTASITATDPAGNTSAPITRSVNVDTTPPAISSFSATNPPANTNDTTPTFSGTGTPGDTITVTVGGQTLTATVAPDGTWSATPTTPLPEGPVTASITATDPAGNTSAPITRSVNIDTTAPAPGSFDATGPSALTNDTTPTFSGTGTPGDTITVTVGGQTLTATVAPDGTWSATPTTPLPEGPVTASITATDPAGNTSAPITRSVNIDTTPPAISSFSATNPPANTNDTTPTFSGTGTPGDTITVTVGGQTLTATVAPDGTWSATPTTPLPEGPVTASITATDPAGNTSAPITRSVNVDTTGPAAGSFSAALAPASDTGVLGDGLTSDTTPTFAGTGTPGDIISVNVGGQTVTATVAPDGTWSATLNTPLADGSATVSVTATDPAGNVSAPITQTVTVDTTGPAPGSFSAALLPASDTGTLGDGLTSDSTPTFSGTGTPGDTITVTVGGQTVTATVAADGTWSATVSTPLADGPLTVSVTATDPAGNVSTPITQTLTVDTTGPAPGSFSAALVPASDTGTLGDGLTSDSTPTFGGTGSPGDTITVTLGGQTVTATVAPDGTWSATLTAPLPDGPATVTITATDPAGNAGTPITQTVTIDTAAPIGLTAVLDAASDTGAAGDNLTNDTTPTFSGTGTAGDTITVAVGSQTVTAIVAPDGTWSATLTTPLADGAATVTITATDPAGNAGTPVTQTVTIDAAAPTGLTAVLAPASDSGVAGDNITSDSTPTFSGTGTAGDTITVSVGGQTVTAIVAPDGTWSATLTTPLADGPATVTITATDPAGNAGTPITQTVTTDTTAPTGFTAVLAPASDSGVAGDNLTNDSTPTFSGTGTAGDTITVSVGGQTVTAIVAPDGTWSATLATPLADGSAAITITATDPAGNAGTPITQTVTIDSTAPTGFTAVLAPASDSGVAGDNITSDSTPTFSGTGTAGDTITVSVGGQTVTAIVAPDGTWSATLSTPLADGSAAITITATDPAGNAGTPITQTVTVDTTAPTGLTAVLAPASDSGVAGDNITSDSTPTFSGTGTAGDTITVSVGGQTVTAIVAPDGTWSATLATPLADGPAAITITATDPAGNAGTPITQTVTIDSTAPTGLTAVLAPASDSGVAGDNLTNDSTPTFSGTGTAGDTITLSVGGQTVTAIVAPDGTWSATLTTPLADGPATVTITATDPAGNAGTPITQTVTTDTTAPTGLTAVLAPASDSGVAGDNITSDSTPTFSGTGTAGDTITVSVSGQTVTAIVAPDGTWSATLATPLADGPAAITITATDPAGNAGTPITQTVTIDTTAPTGLTAVLAAASDSGVAGDNLTNDSTPTFSGTGTAGDTITVSVGGQTVTVTVAPDGTWSATLTTPLPDGPAVVTITATDPAGNAGTPITQTVTIDTTAPTGLTAVLAPASDSGVAGDNLTNDSTPTFSGTGNAGDTITVSVGGQTVTATVAPDGTWSATLITPLPDGPAAVTITATDPAGNAGTPITQTVTIDTTAPTGLTAVLAPASDSGVAGDNLTSDNTPTFSGTGTAGDTITVSVGGQTVTATVAPDGTWSATLATPLADGPAAITITATDPAGNAGTPITQTVTVDTTAPTFTAVLDAASDTGTAGDNLTNDTTPTFSGTGTAGDTITVTVGGQTVIATVAANGTWNATLTTPLVEGPATVSITATDPAGNVSAPVTQVVTIDTTRPTLTAVVDAASDTGTVGDNITSDTTPTFSGNGTAGDTVTVTVGSEVVTAIVGPGGTWSATLTTPLVNGSATASITATDPAGNASLPITLNLTIDTTAPVFTARLDAASDSGASNSDGITSDTTPVISGTAEPGNVIEIDVPGGGTVSVTADAAGNWSATLPALAQGSQTLPVRAIDAAGNVANTTVSVAIDSIAPTAPVVTLVRDANNDGSVNAAEAAAGPNEITVGLPGDAVAGDVVTVSDGTTTQTITLTAAQVTAGVLSVALPALVDGMTPTYTATITDTAGNVSAAGSDSALVDLTPIASAAVVISTDADNNGFLNAAEVGSGTTAAATVTLPSGAVAGDTLRLSDDAGNVRTFLLTAADVTAGTLSATFPLPAEGAVLTVNGTLTDVAGNVTTLTADSATRDTFSPGSAIIAINADTNNDGIVSAAEATLSGPTTTITVTLPTLANDPSLLPAEQAQVGDVLLITGGASPIIHVVTFADLATGTITFTTALPADGSTMTLVTSLTDGAGNVSPLANDVVRVDTSPPAAPTVAITEGGNVDGFLSAAELSGAVEVTVTLPTGLFEGDTLIVIDQAGNQQSFTLTAAAITAGVFVANVAAPAEGQTLSVTARIQDLGGNTSADSAPATALVDTTAPTVPTPALGVDTGVLGDSITNRADTPIVGVGAPGSIITVTVAGQTLTTTVAPDGSWSVQPTPSLADGPVTATVVARDAAGNQSSPVTLNFTVDTAVPTVTAQLSASSDSGTAGDNLTNDTTPTISGTGTAGDTITVSVGGQTLTATVAADGTWSATPTTPLPQGAAAASITATDPAGNVSTPVTLNLTIDSTPPATSSFNANGTPALTNDSTPTFSGTGTPGDTITVVVNGQTITAVVNAAGTWSATPTTPLPDGVATASVTATDPAGNVSAPITRSVTIDTVPPTLTAVLAAASDSGTAGDNITNDNTPTFSGTGTAGDTITVTVSGQTVTTTVAANGTWSATLTTPLADGAVPVSITATDPAGNTSTPVTQTVTIDTTASTLTAVLDAASDSGAAGDNLTNDTTPTFSGTGTAGDTITLTIGGQTVTAVVAANGTWSATPTTPLPQGVATASITATDPAGNVSAAITRSVTIDTTAPAFTSELAPASDSGTAGDNRTNATLPTLRGTTDPNATVRATVASTGEVITVTADGSGSWSLTLTQALAQGLSTVNFLVTDVAGNQTTASRGITVDTAGPTFGNPPVVDEGFVSTVLSASTLGATDNTATLANLNVTAVNFVSAAGFSASDFSISAPAGGAVTVTRTGSPEASGTVVFSVQMTDDVGNTRTQNVTLTVNAVNDAPTAEQTNFQYPYDNINWSFNVGSPFAAGISGPSFASGTNIVAGAGASLAQVSSYAQISNLSSTTFAQAQNAGDYLQVTFTTSATAAATSLDQIGWNQGSGGVGFNFTLLVSDDNFLSYTVLVNNATYNPTGGFSTLATTNPFGMNASTTYQARMYMYNLASGTTATFDDLFLFTPQAIRDPLRVNSGDSLDLREASLVWSDIDAVSTDLMTLTLSVPTGTNGSFDVTATTGVTIVSGDNTNSVVVRGTLANLNAFLATAGAALYIPNISSPPSVTITATLNDGGSSGSGGAQTGTETITVNITPVLADTTGPSFGNPPAVLEGFTSTVFNATTLGATDNLSTLSQLNVTSVSFVSSPNFSASDFSIGTASGGAVTVTRTGGADTAGIAVFSVQMTDAAGNLTTQNVTLTVTGVNDAPTAAQTNANTTRDEVYWSFNTGVNFGATVSGSSFASGANITAGAGASIALSGTASLVSNLSSTTFAQALAANDYVQVAFTTSATGGATAVDQVVWNQFRTGVPGYNTTILVSDDNFTSYTVLLNNTNFSGTAGVTASATNPFAMNASTTYQVRMYIYGLSTGTTADVDDLIFRTSRATRDPLRVNSGDSLDLREASLVWSDIDAVSTDLMTLTLSVPAGTNGTFDVTVTSGVTIVSGDNTSSVVVQGTLANLNAFLATTGAVSFIPDANAPATVTITAALNDGGSSGTGGALTTTETITVNITPVERVVTTGGNDVINGDAGNNTLYGAGGADTINGGQGDDMLVGGAGFLRNGSFEHWTAIMTGGGNYPNWYEVSNQLSGWIVSGGVSELNGYGAVANQTENTMTNSANSGDGRYALDTNPNLLMQSFATQPGGQYTVRFELTDLTSIGDATTTTITIDGVQVATVSSTGALTLFGGATGGSSTVDGAAGGSWGNDRIYQFTFTADSDGASTLGITTGSPASSGYGRPIDDVRVAAVTADGNDVLSGGDGADRLWGMAGSNTLTGGAGADRFVVSRNVVGTDTVTDFQVGTDKLVLADLLDLAGTAATSNPTTVANSNSLLTTADLINSGGVNQTVTWNNTTKTLTFGWGGSITFTGMTTSYADANAFLAANGVLTLDGFNNGI